MEIYSYSEARQKLSSVLDKAKSTGKVLIRREDGRTYALLPEHSPIYPLKGASEEKRESKKLSRIQRRQDAVSIRGELYQERWQEKEIGRQGQSDYKRCELAHR